MKTGKKNNVSKRKESYFSDEQINDRAKSRAEFLAL